jgi:hypothetical protein
LGKCPTPARRIRSFTPGATCSPTHPRGVLREDGEGVRDTDRRKEIL